VIPREGVESLIVRSNSQFLTASRYVIPREGVERRRGRGEHNSERCVIPREGVERVYYRTGSHKHASEEVIPREGVESQGSTSLHVAADTAVQ